MGNWVRVTWPGSNGVTYTVQGTTNLVAGAWTNVPPHIDLPGPGGMMTATDAVGSAGHKAYRVLAK
jgi:hypothetical protein